MILSIKSVAFNQYFTSKSYLSLDIYSYGRYGSFFTWFRGLSSSKIYLNNSMRGSHSENPCLNREHIIINNKVNKCLYFKELFLSIFQLRQNLLCILNVEIPKIINFLRLLYSLLKSKLLGDQLDLTL